MKHHPKCELKVNENNDSVVVLRIDSLDDVLEFCEQTKSLLFAIHNDESYLTTRSDFNGGISPEKAHQLVRNGWPEGIEASNELCTMIKHKIGNRIKIQCPKYEVSGGVPDVGCFLSNDPEHFITREPIDREGVGTCLRFRVNLGVSALVSNEAILNRGIAVVATALALESAGKSTEIDVFYAGNLNYGAFDHFKSNKVQVEISVKKFGYGLEMDKLAFCMGHPAFFRRWIFHLIRATSCNNSGLGTPVKDWFPEVGDIQTPELYGSFSEDEAVTYALKCLETSGVLIE